MVTGTVTADCVLDTGAVAPEGVGVEGPDTAANVLVTGEVALPRAVPTVWVAAVATPVCVIGAATDVAVVAGWVEYPAVALGDEVGAAGTAGTAGAAGALDGVERAPDVVAASAPMLDPALDGALGDAADPTRPIAPEESADPADEVSIPRAEARPEPSSTTKATTATIPNTTRASERTARVRRSSRLFRLYVSVSGFIDRHPQLVLRDCRANRSLGPAHYGDNPVGARHKPIRSAQHLAQRS